MSSHIWTIFLLILLVSDEIASAMNFQFRRQADMLDLTFRCFAEMSEVNSAMSLNTHMFLRSVSKEIVPETTTRHLLQQRASEDGGASSHVDRHRWSDSEEASRSVRHGRGRAKDDLNNFRDVSKSSSGGMTSSSASVRHFNIEKSPSAWKLAFTNNNSSSALISSKQNSLDDFEETLSSRRNWDSEKQSTFLDCDNCPIYDEMLLSQDSKLRVTRDQTDLQSSHGVPDSMSTMPLNSCILPVVRPLEDMVETMLKRIGEWMLGPVTVYEIDDMTGQIKVANSASSFLESDNDMSRAERLIRPIYNSAKSAYRRMKISSQPLIETARTALKSMRIQSSSAGDLLSDNRMQEG